MLYLGLVICVLGAAGGAAHRCRFLRVRTLSAMAKARLSRLRLLMFWFTPITRSPAQKSACKDLGRNGQNPAITLKAAHVLVYAHNALTGAEVCT